MSKNHCKARLAIIHFQILLGSFPLTLQEPDIKRLYCVQMDIALRVSNHYPGLIKECVYPVADIALDYFSVHQPLDAHPAIKIKDQCIITKITKENEWFRSL